MTLIQKLAIVRLGCVADSTERYQQAEEIKNQCLLSYSGIGMKAVQHALRLYWNTAYDQFLVSRDPVIEGAVPTLETLNGTFGFQILFLSRRPESHLRSVTEQWLARAGRVITPVCALETGKDWLVMSASAFQPERVQWALEREAVERMVFAGLVETFARLFGVHDLLYVDYDEENRLAIEAVLGNLPGEGNLWFSPDLAGAVELLA